MLGKVIITIGLVAAGLLLIVVNTTSPSSIGAGGILLVFVLSYIVILSGVSCLIWLASRAWLRLSSQLRQTRQGKAVDFKRAYYYASVVALAPVILLSLQSVGGAGIYEIALVSLLVALGCIYISKRAA